MRRTRCYTVQQYVFISDAHNQIHSYFLFLFCIPRLLYHENVDIITLDARDSLGSSCRNNTRTHENEKFGMLNHQ